MPKIRGVRGSPFQHFQNKLNHERGGGYRRNCLAATSGNGVLFVIFKAVWVFSVFEK
jgi:hypothetical protein